jgi:16S rRNA (cytosine967-C5)-methyltransferase
VPAQEVLTQSGFGQLETAVRFTEFGLQMTPLRTGTDGFFVAVLRSKP